MKKLSGRFLDMMKLNEDDEFDDMIEDEFDEEEEEEEETPKRRFSLFGGKKEEDEEEEEAPAPVVQKTTKVQPAIQRKNSQRKGSNIVSIGRGEEVKVVKPQSFNESKTITDYLKANKTVVVNLEGIEITTAQRIIDCIGGASYALGGSLEPISGKIFIVAPKDIEVSGDLLGQLTGSGDSFISPDLGNF